MPNKIPEEFKKIYEKQGYRFVGKNQHSAVKICKWTKESISRGRNCFKRWYGVESHRCLQCTVSLFCLNRCVYCWRTFHPFFEQNMESMEIDEPAEIIEELIKQQRLLLTGFKGNPSIDRKKYEEAQYPNNAALSLIGESLLYPKISELLKEFHKRNFTTFLLTKGTLPEKIMNLEVEPTNFYISLCAPDKQTFIKVDNPLVPNAWEKQMESLELMRSFSCRKVIRLTLVKELNLKEPEKYAKLILRAEPDFIEAKAFFHVGEAQKRLPRAAMPTMDDIRKFAQNLSESAGYKIKDEDLASRVVLLAKT
ncbi:MAG: 4-demethylwyosine synthase TYW1 [Candidatus Aenigmarchaeota archaeon]|nr:4-demethylwyosine synthase TYW1 [Candidatus Aenigmarchaeota archaeon]